MRVAVVSQHNSHASREMRRKQAAEDKQQDGLRPPSVPEIVQRFMGVAGIGDLVPAAGRQSEKAAAGADKGNSSQPPAALFSGSARIKPNGTGRKEKIQRTSRKPPASVSPRRRARAPSGHPAGG